jgi:xylan 1,4-beta-xylosidase
LRAKGGINKPSYYGFALLHQLGDRRVANPSKNVIVTTGANGSVVIAAWNLVDPGQQPITRTMDLVFQGVPADAKATLQRVDSQHGNVLSRYAAMGKPLDPTPAQVDQLNRETALPAAEQTHLTDGKLKLQLEANSLVLVKVNP